MARRTVLPLSLAFVAVAAASFGPGGRAGAADMARVTARDSRYTPARQTVRAGETVIFDRAPDAELPHSVTSDTGDFDQELTAQRYVGLRFNQPGTYAFHCKHHGSPGGRGMSGVILVEDASAPTSTTATTEPDPTTTTTEPTTTTSTGPSTTTSSTAPTTTTTKPPKTTTTTTTRPPTTTTTSPPPPPSTQPPQTGGWISPPPSGGWDSPPPTGRGADPPPPSTAPAPRPSAPAATRRGAPAGGAQVGAADTKGRGPATARNPAPTAPPTPDTTPPPPPVPQPDQATIDAVAAALAAAATPPPEPAAPAPTEPPPVEPIDPLILDTLAAGREEKPPDNGSQLLVCAGVALGMFLLAVAGWAFYHRSSRYMPA